MGNVVPVDPLPIGFDFPFYGYKFSTFYACQKGFISFTSRNTPSSNQSLPSLAAPKDLVAAWWDDLNALRSKVYYYNDGNRLIIQYQDVAHASANGNYTFETILYPDGTIILQYLSMSGYLTSATVGIQNSTRTDGLQVVCNAPFVHDSLAVRLSTRIPSWLSVTPTSGSVPPGGRVDLVALFDPKGLEWGEYYSGLKIRSNDPTDSVRIVPVHMTVSAFDTVRLDLDPNTLNLGSNGQWITGYVKPPPGHEAADIRVGTVQLDSTVRSEERRVGKECRRLCRSRWSPYH
jgi:hypothetical protein